MTINDIASELMRVCRYSEVLYEGDIDEVDIGNNPERESHLRIKLNSAQTGTIYLNGSTVETLTYSSSKAEQSVELFTSLSGVTPASLSGTMTITAWDESGSPVETLSEIETVYGYFRPVSNMMRLKMEGMRADYHAILHVNQDANIENEDIIKRMESNAYVEYVVKDLIKVTGIGCTGRKEMGLVKKP